MRGSAAGAAMWSAVDLLGRQGISFFVSIILARLLTPADFGAVALASFFATFAIAAVQNALSTAVIQRHQAADDEVSSVFWWNLIISTALAASFMLSAPGVAAYFKLPLLRPLMVAAAAQVILASLGSVHAAMLTRELRFAAIAKASIPATLGSGLIGVSLAFSGFGVWALVAQLVSAAAFNSAALWLTCSWRPSIILHANGLSDALRFARWLSISGVLEVAYTQGFALFLGKLYGPHALGLYGRAASTQQLPGNVISGIIARVALPLLSLRRDDPRALGRGLLAANRMAMVLSLPALAGLALTSDLVMRVLFGPQWNDASKVLAILAWAGAIYPLQANNLQALLASGRSDLYFKVELIKKLVGVCAIVIGSIFGIMGLAWSQLIFAVVALVINTWPAGQLFGTGLVRQIVDLKGIILATSVMAVAILLVRIRVQFSDAAALGLLVCVGVCSYLLICFVVREPALRQLLEISKVRKTT